MIGINGFSNYDYCPNKGEVFRGNTKLKANFDKKEKFWFLYEKGEKFKVKHWQILLNNWEKIEREVLRKVTDFRYY